MVHHLVLFKLRPEVDEKTVESMMRDTRIYLLRIPEVLAVRCGKRINPKNQWSFFVGIDVDSMEKLEIYSKNANHVKYVEEIIKPHVVDHLSLDYESDPAKDIRYS
ncbi:MAG: hypothetical protein C5B47_08360 [Verrucomicrobia bacterium]|nr:MAG: hypothetical protein C5B47_08360 [Verrucomicrobiota bacterium]